MKRILVISLLLAANSAMAKCVDEPAIKYMLWKESANQKLDVQILVMRVLENRVKKFKTSYCTELLRKGAYPYMKRGVKTAPKEFLERYKSIRKSEKFKSVKFIYFNHVPHKFGKRTKKIGGLYFSE